MLEEEHREICLTDNPEEDSEHAFVLRCKKLLEEEKGQPCISYRPTHQLIFNEKEKTYKPVKIQQYERGDLP